MQVLDTLPHPLIVKDRNLAYVAVNKAFTDIYGLAGEAVLGGTAWDVVDAENAARIDASDRAVLETGVPFRNEEHIVGIDGSDLYIVTRKYRIGVPENYVVVTVMDDVTHIVDRGEEGANRSTHRSTTDFRKVENCFDPVREIEKRLLLQHWSSGEDIDFAGRRILVVTATQRTEGLLTGHFRAHRAECCAVRSLGW